jgi:hypothetical protein
MFRAAKDAALGAAVRTAVNARLGPIGEVMALSIDTAARRARVSVMLSGEPAAVHVEVHEYVLEIGTDGPASVTLRSVSASRQWLELALQGFAVGRPFPLPPAAARALRLLT